MRRLLIILGCLLGGAILALVALPWWLGPVAKKVAPHWGVSFANYERVGYARFVVYDVVYQQPVVRVTAERVEADTPLLWLWHHATGTSRIISATHWLVDVRPRPDPPTPTPISGSSTMPAPSTSPSAASASQMGAMSLRTLLLKIATELDRWLPRAEIGPGIVRWPTGELRFASGRWEKRALHVRGFGFGAHEADVTADFSKDGIIAANAISAGKSWHTELKSQGDQVTGDVHIWDQPATLSAKFAAQDWLPASATVQAANWRVAGTRVKLGKFYSVVRGDARLDWSAGKFETAVDASSEPLDGDKKVPPLAVKLRGRGDLQTLNIESLLVDAPGIAAKLSAPVELDRRGVMHSAASDFTVTVDLAKQPWFEGAQGSVTGVAHLTPRDGGVPLIAAKLDGRDVTFREWKGMQCAAEAALEWPRLQMKSATIALGGNENFAAHGTLDLEKKEVSDAEAKGTTNGAIVAHWLPAALQLGTVTLTAKAHGPLAALAHEGTLHAPGLKVRGLRPLAVDTAWQGTGASVQLHDTKIKAGVSEIDLAGAVNATEARLTVLRFTQNSTERLALAQPATLRWSPTLELESTRLAAGDSSVAVTLVAGERGRFEATAKNISSTWWSDFVELPGPEWRVGSLAARGEWEKGPMTFTVSADLSVPLATDRVATIKFEAQGGADGVKIETLDVAEATAPIFTARGRVPLRIQPRIAGALVNFQDDAPLELRAAMVPNPDFWKKFTEGVGLEFQEPDITAEISGTWAHPKGEVNAKVARIAADPQRIKWPFPTVENLEAHATGDREGVAIERLVVKVDGQAVTANGKLPLSPARWKEFTGDALTFVRKEGNLHLEIPDADVAVISHYLPAWLAPAGRLQLDATLKPGGDMEGTAKLRGAASRPLGPLGVFQEIEADVALHGRDVEVRSLQAQSGGQPVTLTGKVQLPVGGAPKFDLALKGENLPLVRQTGLLVRADLDLKLATQSDGVPEISGSAKLRDSVFLSDVRALIPHGGGGGPARRPPFFSVAKPPFNAWRLNVDVSGDKFMRLHSTAFVGVASAHLRLLGRLDDPRAIGDVTVDTGQVLLPFAAFKVDQGAVRLTEADPYSLTLNISGTARRYGYDLRMDITGTAAQPVTTFSSSPPLEARQVLLMVMAGEMPHDEIVYGSTQRVARIGAYLGQSLITTFGGESTDADRLSITTGERVSEQGRETYDIEYQLNDRFTLVGEYDEYDDFNAGIKWRVVAPDKAPVKKVAPPVTAQAEKPPP